MQEVDCENCGVTMEIPDAVVNVCSTHRRDCRECGHSNWFNFRGASV